METLQEIEVPIVVRNQLPVITQEKVMAQMNIALTQQSISVQKIQDEINSIEFNEDNLQKIADMITVINKSDKIIEAKHKELKAPYLDGGKICDLSKNSLLSINEGLREQLLVPYNKMCADIEQRKRVAAQEATRIASIKEGIENNLISFSSQVAQCETNLQLLAVERVINLEKSETRASKYMEFHLDAISRYDSVLLPIIKAQKLKIKQKEAIKTEIIEAETANDPIRLDELNSKQDRIDNEILQNQINVQQDALNNPSFFIPVAEEVLPDIHTVTRIKFDIVDLNVAIKKCPELLDVTIKHRDAQKIAMTLKDVGTFKDKSEVVVNGIKFFIDKSYKP